MKRIIQLGIVLVGLASLTACSTWTPGETGTMTGAVAGGVIGAAASGGNPYVTVGGTVVGGLVGHEVGRNWYSY